MTASKMKTTWCDEPSLHKRDGILLIVVLLLLSLKFDCQFASSSSSNSPAVHASSSEETKIMKPNKKITGNGSNDSTNNNSNNKKDSENDVAGYPRDDTNVTNDERLKITVVNVIAMGRSSSTYLTRVALGQMPCHLTVEEILTEKNAKKYKAATLYPHHNTYEAGPFVLAVLTKECQKMFSKNATLAQQCDWHCYPNFKSKYKTLDPAYFPKLWEDLKPFQEKAIILERKNLKEQWLSRSFSHAAHFYNQGILPEPGKSLNTTRTNLMEHKNDLEQYAKANPQQALEVPEWFVRDHQDFYQLARQTTHDLEIPVLEINYKKNIETPIDELRNKILIPFLTS